METNNKRFIIVHHLPTDVLPRKEFSIDFYWTGTFSACTRLERNEMRHCSLSSFEYSIIIKFLKIIWKPRLCGMNISEQMLALFIIHLVVTHGNFIVCFMFLGMFHPPVNNYKNIEPHESPLHTYKSLSTSRSVIKETTCSPFTSMRKVYSAFTLFKYRRDREREMLCFRHNHQLCATARFTYEWIEFCEIYEICGCWIFERKFIIKLYLKYRKHDYECH